MIYEILVKSQRNGKISELILNVASIVNVLLIELLLGKRETRVRNVTTKRYGESDLHFRSGALFAFSVDEFGKTLQTALPVKVDNLMSCGRTGCARNQQRKWR